MIAFIALVVLATTVTAQYQPYQHQQAYQPQPAYQQQPAHHQAPAYQPQPQSYQPQPQSYQPQQQSYQPQSYPPQQPAHQPQPYQAPSTQARQVPPPAAVHYVNIGAELAGDYKFGYDTGKGQDQSFREETRLPDGSVKGAYGYVDETGKQRVIRYTAGKDGYKVEGDGIPKAPNAPAPAPAQAAPAHQGGGAYGGGAYGGSPQYGAGSYH